MGLVKHGLLLAGCLTLLSWLGACAHKESVPGGQITTAAESAAISAISTVSVNEGGEQPGRPDQPQHEDIERQSRVQALLEMARAALDADRLMTPPDDSAYFYYRQALPLDPGNDEAHWGMRSINARYLEWAEQAFKKGQRADAEMHLRRALMIATSPAQAAALRAKYPGAAVARKVATNEFLLSKSDLSARNQTIMERLHQVALKAQQEDSRLLIVARNDAEGRWIYQQMRAAIEGFKLRGNIELGAPPRVVLIDMLAEAVP